MKIDCSRGAANIVQSRHGASKQRHVSCRVLQERTMYNFPGVLDYCTSLYDKSVRSPHLLSFMIDCFEEMLDDKTAAADINKANIGMQLMNNREYNDKRKFSRQILL